MSIKAIVDDVEYTDIETVTAGGKTVELEEVLNLQTKTVTTNGDVLPDAGYLLSKVTVNVNTGTEPTGNIDITDMNITNVAAYATARVVDADLVAGNIKKDVNILGVVGTYEGGGGAIQDGLAITARDSNGYATAITKYGSTVGVYELGAYNKNTSAFKNLQTLTFADAVTTLKESAFENLPVDISIPSTVTSIGKKAFYGSAITNAVIPIACSVPDGVFNVCTALETYIDEKPETDYWNISTGIFNGCTALTSVQLGSIGNAVNQIRTMCFKNCTQAGLTITLYGTGATADALVTNTRSSATNATIIIKASENTTYGGNSYAAGETITTSTPT